MMKRLMQCRGVYSVGMLTVSMLVSVSEPRGADLSISGTVSGDPLAASLVISICRHARVSSFDEQVQRCSVLSGVRQCVSSGAAYPIGEGDSFETEACLLGEPLAPVRIGKALRGMA